MASLTQVAKQAGVSLATASIVLNPGKQENRVSTAVAQRVREVAECLGYVPNYHARSMKLGRAEVIAVALDLGGHGGLGVQSELGMTYFGSIIGAVEMCSRTLGYHTTIIGPNEQMRAPDRGLLGLRQRRFDGMVVLGVVVRPEQTAFMSQPHKLPIVVVEYPGKTPLPVVDWDEAEGLRLAVTHLAEHGHRRLLWLGPGGPGDAQAALPRERIFMETVRDAGLRAHACRFERPANSTPGQLADAAEAALRGYLDATKRNFTGIVCYNDAVAIGAYGALQAVGLRIPQDISVIGIDDVEAVFAIPRLTTVSHRLGEMGRCATELLMEMIRSPERRRALRGHRQIIRPELIVRKSTAAAAR